MNEPALSIVVIGRNEAPRLARCLESLTRSRGVAGEMEIIYVDSASTDESPAIAGAHCAEVIVLHTERPTAARGRNAGWRKARAPFVLFLDGDTVLHERFASTALDAMRRDPQIAAVWGHRRELHPGDSVYNRVLDLDWIYAPGDTEYCGGDVLMRKSALEEAGGYDQDLIAGEEPELCRRLRARGYRISHIDAPMTGHDLHMTHFTQYWKRALRAGHAYAETASRFRASADPMWQRESRGNLLRGGFWVVTLAASLALVGFTRLPLLLWFAVLGGLALRSAWKARWKAPGNHGTLFLFGLHSHIQQVPIALGQLQFHRDRKTGKRSGLIEYKEGSSA
jgi:cellulose synthase/poly-beta-1,6-N-acetylglucosamine synthase-like glycosyltransferase